MKKSGFVGGMIAVVLGLLAFRVSVQATPDSELIPPEILRKMDADILSGKRPRIHQLKQADIFGLRDRPELDTDFVVFAFAPQALSSAQEAILDDWIKSGANRILFSSGSSLFNYRKFLEPVAITREFGRKRSARAQPVPKLSVSRLRHPVNTGVREITMQSRWESPPSPSSFHFAVGNLPPGSAVILEVKNKAVCGAFPLGKGTIYFRPHEGYLGGTDARLWMLNWRHWALGLPVPGAPKTTVTRTVTSRRKSGGDPSRDQVTVHLRDGRKIKGKLKSVGIEVFPGQTVEIHSKDIARIEF